VSSGCGGFLYLEKDGSYDPPGIYGAMLIGAVAMITREFWNDVEWFKANHNHNYYHVIS